MFNIENLWQLVLRVYETIQSQPLVNYIALSFDGSEYNTFTEGESDPILIINFSEEKVNLQSETIIKCDQPFSFKIIDNSFFDSDSIDFLALYLPYAIIPHFSKKLDKVFVISHFAQTLDGRIASESGDSKWIGNQENLIHAHRMRALSDAIGVGSNTLKIDQPSLNVRHVEGRNPIKIIIGKPSTNLGKIDESREEVLFINNESLGIDENANEQFCETSKIIQYLREQGIKTFYLEGGSTTSSLFLKGNCIDQVQIHISPKILGSGKVGFSFEGIDTMNEVIEFKNYKFLSMGDQTMFIGEL